MHPVSPYYVLLCFQHRLCLARCQEVAEAWGAVAKSVSKWFVRQISDQVEGENNGQRKELPLYPPLRVRALTDEQARVIGKLVRSQTASVRLVQRANRPQLCPWRVKARRLTIPQITAERGCAPHVVCKWVKWVKRFEEQGLAGLNDAHQARVVATARTRPRAFGLPSSRWTFERLALYLREHLDLPLKKTRIFELLRAKGWRWRQQETWLGERLDPDDPEFAQQRGRWRRCAPTHQPLVSS
jgi:transposase